MGVWFRLGRVWILGVLFGLGRVWIVGVWFVYLLLAWASGLAHYIFAVTELL